MNILRDATEGATRHPCVVPSSYALSAIMYETTKNDANVNAVNVWQKNLASLYLENMPLLARNFKNWLSCGVWNSTSRTDPIASGSLNCAATQTTSAASSAYGQPNCTSNPESLSALHSSCLDGGRRLLGVKHGLQHTAVASLHTMLVNTIRYLMVRRDEK
jgi:hypothetical protein